jgi:hypothetical protein
MNCRSRASLAVNACLVSRNSVMSLWMPSQISRPSGQKARRGTELHPAQFPIRTTQAHDLIEDAHGPDGFCRGGGNRRPILLHDLADQRRRIAHHFLRREPIQPLDRRADVEKPHRPVGFPDDLINHAVREIVAESAQTGFTAAQRIFRKLPLRLTGRKQQADDADDADERFAPSAIVRPVIGRPAESCPAPARCNQLPAPRPAPAPSPWSAAQIATPSR